VNRPPKNPRPPSSPGDPETRPRTPSSGELAAAKWEAFGTSVVLRLTNLSALQPARATIERELDAIDRACSRFRPDSELSRVNARAGRPVQASPLFIEALEVALRAAELTGGDVDPTVGRALELAGYDRDLSLLAPPREEPERRGAIIGRVRSGWRTVTLDRASSSIRIPTGIRLDLGATAKAWAADRAASAAAAATGCGVLVSLGGDIATSGPAPADGWRIVVTDDHRSDPSAPGQTISILSGGLATSSTAVRRWSHDGHTMHHIIDPGTGTPVARTWRTVSVAAASATEANIATTAALVRADAAPAWLAGLGLPARLVDWDGKVTAVGDWPAEAPASARDGHSAGDQNPAAAGEWPLPPFERGKARSR
jgi:thiamine biosynthesis lipoprotein ApbE